MTEQKLQITENDVEYLFRTHQYPSAPSKIWAIFKIIFGLVLIFGLVFVGFNWPSLFNRLKYFWVVDYRNQTWQTSQSTVNNQQLTVNQIPANEGQTPNVAPTEDNTLTIAKLGIKAPIFWNIPEEQILDKLTDGVVHYQGTAVPGEKGNIFITGHSSNYWWKKGNFNQIFALLDKLVVGDKINLTYGGKEYIYQISKIQTVKPSQVEALAGTEEETLTLMTCVPVGTTLNRLLVQAKPVNPQTPQGSVSTQVNPKEAPTPFLPFWPFWLSE